jgi:hypothetical protein
MKKSIIIVTIASIFIGLNSCNRKGCTDELAYNYNEKSKKDDGTCTYKAETIKLEFTHNFNGDVVTANEFEQLNYTNANGQNLSFTKLQYSISDVRFYLPNGDSVMLDGTYHLVDLEDEASLTYSLPDLESFIGDKEYKAKFTGVGFNYGFDVTDNVSGAYTDLNAKSWSWPDMIGGGYHQLKMEGRFIDAAGATTSFQYHNGSATKNSSGDFESNYRYISLSDSDFDLKTPTTVEIKMNLANWFVTPNTWDLNQYSSMLMPNYTAQKMMQQNAVNVFSVGEIGM